MRKKSGIVRGWTVLFLAAFLAIPFLGWSAFTKDSSAANVESGQTSETVKAPSISAYESLEDNVQRGQKLFMGYAHLQNGGPPCMGCHNVGSNGLLGGGAIGPDLTNVSRQRSQEEIASILSNDGLVVSPVMQPIFTEHPLTESEQADLIAFLNASVGQPESNREILVLGISLAGFAVAVILLGFLYRNRLRGVRKLLVRKAHSKKP